MPRRAALLASVLAAGGLASASPAAGAEPISAVEVDREVWTLHVASAKAGDCRDDAGSGGGVATRTYRTPVAGFLKARLRAPGGDWDLAVVEAATGRVLGASLGFGAREVVTVPVGASERLLLRACRRRGGNDRAQLELAYATPASVPEAERLSLVEVPVDGPADHARLDALGFDTADHSDGHTLQVVLHGPDDAVALTRAGFRPRTVVLDVLEQDRRDRLAELAAERSGTRSPLPSGRTTYRTLADYQADMKALAEQHPQLVRGFVLPGTSLEEREISGIEIAAGVERGDDGRPQVYVDGVNHAREWPAGEIPMEFAIDLVKNPKGDPRLTAILEAVRTFVVPIINVDGFDVSRTAGQAGVFETAQFGDLPWAATGTGAAYKRKNCRHADQTPPPDTPCIVAHALNDLGVDTNRNYGFGWGGPGASTTWAEMTYRGAAAFSEPETTALRKFMFGLQPAVVVSTHNVAALMLRPPGQRQTPDTPDEAPMKALGDAMGQETGYRSQRSWQLYDTTGTTIDWTYGALGAWSYTPELGGSGFHGPHPRSVVEQYEGNGERGGMRGALVLAARAAMEPASHAVIAGRAPAGRTLRISRAFVTTTWNKQPLDPDTHSSTLTVPASGSFEWHVMPARRPYEPAGSWALTCERDGVVLDQRELALERGDRVTVDLDCGDQAPAQSRRSTTGAGARAPGCLEGLASVRLRTRRGTLAVRYKRRVAGKVTVDMRRGKRTIRRLRGGRRGVTFRRLARLRRGRYTVRVTLLRADGRREVRRAALRKSARRLRVGRVVGRGC